MNEKSLVNMSTVVILLDIDGTIVKKNNPFVIDKGIKDVINGLKAKGCSVGIYSQGFKFIQRMKLKIQGIYRLFDKQYEFISLNKFNHFKANLDMLKDKRVIVVDNEFGQIKKLKEFISLSVTPVFLQLNNVKRKSSEEILTITNITQLIDKVIPS